MTEHLNDTEIQQLVWERPFLNKETALHIQNCRYCKLRMLEYKMISGNLEKLPEPAFGPDLSAILMPAIEKKALQPPGQFSLEATIIFVMAAVCFAVVLSALAYGFYMHAFDFNTTALGTAFILFAIAMEEKYRQQLRSRSAFYSSMFIQQQTTI